MFPMNVPSAGVRVWISGDRVRAGCYLPMESDTLKSELRKYQLNVCAGTATIPFYSLEKEECRAIVTPLAQRLKALGVSDMVVMDGSLFGDDKISKSDWDQEKCRVSTIKF